MIPAELLCLLKFVPVIYLRRDRSNVQNEYFWDGDCGLSFSLSGSLFFLFITRLMSFIFEDVTYVLVKRFVLFGCAWITLSICISFILLFCFANFVSWSSLLDWMRFEAVDIQVSRNSFFFRNFVEFQTLKWTANFGFIGVVSEQCSKDIVFLFISCFKKQI